MKAGKLAILDKTRIFKSLGTGTPPDCFETHTLHEDKYEEFFEIFMRSFASLPGARNRKRPLSCHGLYVPRVTGETGTRTARLASYRSTNPDKHGFRSSGLQLRSITIKYSDHPPFPPGIMHSIHLTFGVYSDLPQNARIYISLGGRSYSFV